jgi:predicted  nucleic acid-binding Zn-ribbon protein
MVKEKNVAKERINALRDEITRLTDEIRYSTDVLNARYVDMRHLYVARNVAWDELEPLASAYYATAGL